METTGPRISALIDLAEQGDELSAGKLFSLLYGELHCLARHQLARPQIVDLKFFCGFSIGEVANMQGMSERTVQRRWEKARIYLHRSLRADLPL